MAAGNTPRVPYRTAVFVTNPPAHPPPPYSAQIADCVGMRLNW